MNKERIELISRLTVGALGVGILLYLFFKHLFVPTLPFLIAWGVAMLLRPPTVFISKHTGIARGVIGAVLAFLTVCLGLGGIIALFVYGVSSAWDFFTEFTKGEEIALIFARLTDPIGLFLGDSESAREMEEYLGNALSGAISNIMNKLVDSLTAVVGSVPRVMFFILITAIAAVYFAADLDNINKRVATILPQKLYARLVSFKSRFLVAGLKYLRSYLIIMLITGAELLVGFLILGVRNALLLAIVVSFFDLLPLVGVGTVLVPWSLIELLFGSFPRGIGLAVLFLVNAILRQLLEPKILGKSLGIHPVLSLVLLYLGYSVFGFLGLLLVPLASVIFNLLLTKKETTEVA